MAFVRTHFLPIVDSYTLSRTTCNSGKAWECKVHGGLDASYPIHVYIIIYHSIASLFVLNYLKIPGIVQSVQMFLFFKKKSPNLEKYFLVVNFFCMLITWTLIIRSSSQTTWCESQRFLSRDGTYDGL